MKYKYLLANAVKEVDKYKKANVPHRFMTKAEIDKKVAARDYRLEEIGRLLSFR